MRLGRRALSIPLGLVLALSLASAASAEDFTIVPPVANPNEEITVTPVFTPVEEALISAVGFQFENETPVMDTMAPFAAAKHTYTAEGEMTISMAIEPLVGDPRFVQKQIRINAAPQAGFTFAPTVPNVGDSVLFDAGTTKDDETLANSAFEWDFDNNGSYEAVGKVMPHTFASDGDKTVRLRVTDSLNRTDTVTAVVHVNRPPVANFVYAPSAPQVSQRIDFTSVSADPDDPIVAQAWDLDGDGQYDDASGATASQSFSTAGAHTVRLRVTDSHGRTAAASANVSVTKAPVVAPPKKISPWPKIRIVGFAGRKRVRVDLLTVRTVRGSSVIVRCSGRGCPRKGAVSTRARGKLVRLRWLERRLRTGTRIYVSVTVPGAIGRYEKIVLRKRKKPLRRMLCLFPGDTRPKKC